MKAQLHPLVLLNLSDQVTRQHADNNTTAGAGQQQQPVSGNVNVGHGVLLGDLSGPTLHLRHSFELPSLSRGSKDFFAQRGRQYRTIFPNYEVLGIYCWVLVCGVGVGNDDTPACMVAWEREWNSWTAQD